eukprot:CAMPEP_0117451190 /NCGR_PEP_ID=MMETSP0759-20121206/8877_1 /TAXON_ID=63605 /ORGANISM="Percolomonas cosmopolitus, Strain WS" /LENGTH=935 /DNA_ID=CAMNT_0005243777 /DNA_START=282 /DNA_END=3086 /DNA_ORIENTATION=-
MEENATSVDSESTTPMQHTGTQPLDGETEDSNNSEQNLVVNADNENAVGDTQSKESELQSSESNAQSQKDDPSLAEISVETSAPESDKALSEQKQEEVGNETSTPEQPDSHADVSSPAPEHIDATQVQPSDEHVKSEDSGESPSENKLDTSVETGPENTTADRKSKSPTASITSRQSLAPSMVSGRGSTVKRTKRRISLASFTSNDSTSSTFLINTPRSLRTCDLMGIKPEELVFRPINDFPFPDSTEREIAFKYHEEGRQTLVRQAQEMYAAVCEEQEKKDQSQISGEAGSTANFEHTMGTTDYLENLWVKKLEDQQKRDVAQIIAQEVKRQQREKEIQEELERREIEKRLRDEKLQEIRKKKKEEHIQKVQERVTKVRKSLQEKQFEQLERIREQELKQEMKRLDFERKQEEMYAQNRSKAAEKAKLIQETLQKRQQRELETLIKNEQKQREAEERLESLKEDWEERMEQNRREKEEREKKRKEVIQIHQEKVEQKQRELINMQEEKLRKHDSLIQKRDAELKKRKLEHKMIEKQKQFMVERHLRAKETELRDKLKFLDEKHQKLEENKRQKKLLVEKCKRIQYARQSNRERMKDYLYYMRQTNRIEPPDFVDSQDLKEYLEESGLTQVKLEKRKYPAKIKANIYDHLLGRDKLLFNLPPKKPVLGNSRNGAENAESTTDTAEQNGAGLTNGNNAQMSKTPSPSKKRKNNASKKLSKSVELIRMDSQFLDRSRFFLTNPTPTANIYDTTGIRGTVKKKTKKKKALPPLSRRVYQQSIQDWYGAKGLPVAPGEVASVHAQDSSTKTRKKKRREKVVDIDMTENDTIPKKRKSKGASKAQVAAKAQARSETSHNTVDQESVKEDTSVMQQKESTDSVSEDGTVVASNESVEARPVEEQPTQRPSGETQQETSEVNTDTAEMEEPAPELNTQNDET